jgi:hypothetical protein
MTVREYFEWKPGLVALWVAGVSAVALCVSVVALSGLGPRVAQVSYVFPLLCLGVGVATLREGYRRHHRASIIIGTLAMGLGVAEIPIAWFGVFAAALQASGF